MTTRPTARFDEDGRYLGGPSPGCEHRTVGHRAWCLTCHEWCYPHLMCIRCERAARPTARSDET